MIHNLPTIMSFKHVLLFYLEHKTILHISKINKNYFRKSDRFGMTSGKWYQIIHFWVNFLFKDLNMNTKACRVKSQAFNLDTY